MKHCAIAVFLITVLTGCASNPLHNRVDTSLYQWLFNSSSSPQADSREPAPEPENNVSERVIEVAVPIAEAAEPETAAAEPEPEAAVVEPEAAVAEPEVSVAEPETRTAEAETSEPASDTKRQANAAAEPQRNNETVASLASSTDEGTQQTANPPAPPAGQHNAEQDQAETQSGPARIVIPYANTPFPHLAPQEHPPLNQQEYQQIQQALSVKQQAGENTGRYQPEIARGRTEGGVMAWFYRLWLL